jgi:hypothetical protein
MKCHIILGAIHILFLRVLLNWNLSKSVVIVRKKEYRGGTWSCVCSVLLWCFLDPVAPSSGDCSRQPGQQCDSHRPLGQCFCRACESIPWAGGSWDLDTGVMTFPCVITVHPPPQQKSIEKVPFSLGRQNKKCGKSMGLMLGGVWIQALPPHCNHRKFILLFWTWLFYWVPATQA